MNPEEIVPEWAFAGVPRLRHVSVESGIRLIGAEAWQDCRQLRIVKLPATVVGIADNAFRDCKLLNSVSAPGCRDFGYKAFAECCSFATCVCIEWGCKRALALPKHFVAIGAHACDSCRLLKSVDLCNTMIEEISEFTFVHCTSLREVSYRQLSIQSELKPYELCSLS